MNIFEHRRDFFGCLESELSNGSLMTLFKLANQIRQRLGKQGYLLDSYLSFFFNGVNSKYTSDAADEGIRADGDYYCFISDIISSSNPDESHPVYQRIQDEYAKNKEQLNFQESATNVCLLLFSLADELTLRATADYIEKVTGSMKCNFDVVSMQQLYEQLSHLTSESEMEKLNLLLRQRFMIAPLSFVFAQGFTDELISCLKLRDPETSRQMFQLLLDRMHDIS